MYSIATPFIIIHLVSYAPQVRNENVNVYEGAQVWQTNLRGPSDILLIKELIDNQDISMWRLTPKRADFLVQAIDKLKVNRLLNSQKMNHTVLVLDVQRRMDAQLSETVFWDDMTLRVGHRLNWNKYPTLQIIEEYFDYLKENFPSICEVTTIGHTAENRKIKMVKISNGNPENKAILITSGMHAREWIAITSALYVLDSIVSKFDRLPGYMKNKEWLIIPLLNPDGFEYSHTNDRLWRKNRRQISDCIGVDVNRNFKVDWDVNGITVLNECSESYSGPHPFSEAESMALRDVINSKKKPDALIDLHSYGQFILYPWSAKPKLIDDRDSHKTTAEHISKAIYNATGKKYKAGVAYHTVYPASGTAIDWAYDLGVPLSFAIETGDNSLNGFLVSPEKIENIGKATLIGAKALAKAVDPDIVARGGHYGSWF